MESPNSKALNAYLDNRPLKGSKPSCLLVVTDLAEQKISVVSMNIQKLASG
jgi:hypothetical protein